MEWVPVMPPKPAPKHNGPLELAARIWRWCSRSLEDICAVRAGTGLSDELVNSPGPVGLDDADDGLKDAVRRVRLWQAACAREPLIFPEGAEGDEAIDTEALDEDRAFFKEKAAEVSKQEAAKNDDEWGRWAETAFLDGARKAHAFSREPVGWTPTTTLLKNGIVTADPCELLRAEGVKWNEEWLAVGGEGWQAETCSTENGPERASWIDDLERDANAEQPRLISVGC